MSMSSNKQAREKLEAIYGKGCMFKKAHIEDQIDKLKTIKTYKTFLKETRYTGKKIRLLERNMTYHHLKHQSEGGKATNENGAVVNELAHRYLHSLNREDEEIINNMLRQYKYQMAVGVLTPTAHTINMDNNSIIDLQMDLDNCITIPVYDTTQQDIKKLHEFKRSKQKKETQQLIDEYYQYYDNKEENYL